jgi:hypothetical protein
MLLVKCTKELQTKYVTFKVNEEYSGNRVNNNYWIVDSVGVEIKVFEEHFDAIVKDNKE